MKAPCENGVTLLYSIGREKRHTPGPWATHNNIGRKGELGIVAGGAPCIIAIMGNAKEWPVEAEANAQLIAAAPELLNALEVAQATIERLHRHAPGSANGTLGLIKDAIAKATNP